MRYALHGCCSPGSRSPFSSVLLAGWVAGIGAGTLMVLELGLKSSIYPLHVFGLTIPCYAALLALALNIVVGFCLSVIFNAVSNAPRQDETVPSDYLG